ncbi:MAG: YtxH domain-containing protein [Anaerolineales bacterium]|nr:YtxH domain-containing protein [Anaerolineales bacterium]
MSNNQSSLPYVGAFVLGSVMGGLAGALAGLLLAPKSGAETQAEIKKHVAEFRDQADETLAKGRESLETSLTSTRGKILDTARSKIAEGMEQTASSISQHAKNIRSDTRAAG